MVSTKIFTELPLSLLSLSLSCISEKFLFFCFLSILVSSLECAHNLPFSFRVWQTRYLHQL